MFISKRSSRSSFLRLSIFKWMFLVSALLLLTFVPAVSSATQYTYTEFAPPPADIIYHLSIAGINDNGVGALECEVWDHNDPDGLRVERSYMFNSSGTYTQILPSGWRQVYVTDINNNGVVIGYGTDHDFKFSGFLYSDGSLIFPDALANATPVAINDNNVVLGSDYPGPFIYSAGNYEMIPSPPTPAGYFAVRDINNNGDIAGQFQYGDLLENAMGLIYSGGKYTQLIPPGALYAGVWKINDKGDALVWGSNGNYLYSGGTYTQLAPPWSVSASVGDMNNNVVIGDSCDQNGLCTGFAYSGGTYSMILPPGWRGAAAWEISNKGVIVGTGKDGSGADKLFIAVPSSNDKPVANAGTNQSAVVGTIVTLNGSGSTDPDGDPLTYQWSFVSVPAGSNAVLTSPASVTSMFVPDKQGTYVVQLIVNDGHVNSDPSRVQVLAMTKQQAATQTVKSLETAVASLDTSSLKGFNMQNTLQNKLNAVLADIAAENYAGALEKLENDILNKTNGCATTGAPGRNDWIKTCDAQSRIYPYVLDLIKLVKSMM